MRASNDFWLIKTCVESGLAWTDSTADKHACQNFIIVVYQLTTLNERVGMKRKKAIAGIMLILLLVTSILSLKFYIQPMKAQLEGEPQLVATSKMPELESFFRALEQEPWLGADGAWSINISGFHPNTILWTFGDTLWGRIENGKKVWNMTNNSVALHNLENGTIKFFDDEQINIFEMAEWLVGDELFGPWPFAPFVQNGKIYWFPMVINLTGWFGDGNWLADIYLAEVDNPEDDPDYWNVNYYPIDFLPVRYEPNSFLWLATDVYVENNTYYMYGERDGHYVVARTQENITLFDSWEFYNGTNWTSTPQIVQNGPTDLSTEYSVDYLPHFDKYLLIYQKRSWPTDSRIWGRWAATPIGPWSDPQLLYTPPELEWGDNYWAYAIKGHYPYLSNAHREVVVSYVIRSGEGDEEDLSNPLLYCPYFVKLVFQWLPGDVNEDGKVTITDIVIIALVLGSQLGDPNWNQIADLNGDEKITITDVIIAALHFGEEL